MPFIKTNTVLEFKSDSHIIFYHQQNFLCTAQLETLFPYSAVKQLIISTEQLISIGFWQNTSVFLYLPKDAIELADTQWQALRPIMLQCDLTTFKMLGYASQIASWSLDNQFCGHCGHPMHRDPHENRRFCPSCQFSAYPRLSPSMIALVTRGDEVLLARSPRFTANMYSTLAGFVEAGESVENCVHREIQEEVGIKVTNLHYLGSQNWPYPYSLMLGFHAEYMSGDIVPQHGEIEDAQWFKVTDLPLLPPKQAISRYLIDTYVAQKLGTTKPTLPN